MNANTVPTKKKLSKKFIWIGAIFLALFIIGIIHPTAYRVGGNGLDYNGPRWCIGFGRWDGYPSCLISNDPRQVIYASGNSVLGIPIMNSSFAKDECLPDTMIRPTDGYDSWHDCYGITLPPPLSTWPIGAVLDWFLKHFSP
jgi:hypothetical protein